jgi:N6-L-threonylcarbamoyladenine synthase
LGFPGGPAVEREAASGNPKAHAFPRAFQSDDRLEFSFSGLKTAVRYRIARPGTNLTDSALDPRKVADLAASFQEAVVDCLVGKALLAARRTGIHVLCVGGGVAANARLRERLTQETAKRGIELHIPPMKLCTDNAVMGAIAVERLHAGLLESLDLDVYPGLVRAAKPAVAETAKATP